MGNESNLTMWQPVTQIAAAPVDYRSTAGIAPCASVLHDSTSELQQKTAALAEHGAEKFHISVARSRGDSLRGYQGIL